MSPDLLREIGEALYGERWQTPLAQALGVAVRTMQRWAAGTQPIRESLRDDLRPLLTSRGATLIELSQRI